MLRHQSEELIPKGCVRNMDVLRPSGMKVVPCNRRQDEVTTLTHSVIPNPENK